MATVFLIDRQCDLHLDLSDLGDVIDAMFHLHRAKAGEVSIHFVPLEEICQLHVDYFNDPTSTDCICFPLKDRDKLLGDIFICPKTAVQFAATHQLDPHIEAMRYIAHALLHFLGFGDLQDADRQVMRDEEDRALALFAKKKFSLAPR